MYNVLILWAPDTADNRKVVEAVKKGLESAKAALVVKGAAEATIVDVNAADIVVFGVQKPAAADLPPDFNEFMRIFKGITLAGKTAGFFSMGNEKATARLRKALKDTEISQLEEDPLFGDQRQGPPPSIADWSLKLIDVHQEMHNARA